MALPGIPASVEPLATGAPPPQAPPPRRSSGERRVTTVVDDSKIAPAARSPHRAAPAPVAAIMTVWDEVVGQPDAVAELATAAEDPAAMTHAWLFTGPARLRPVGRRPGVRGRPAVPDADAWREHAGAASARRATRRWPARTPTSARSFPRACPSV